MLNESPLVDYLEVITVDIVEVNQINYIVMLFKMCIRDRL